MHARDDILLFGNYKSTDNARFGAGRADVATSQEARGLDAADPCGLLTLGDGRASKAALCRLDGG